MPDREKVKKSLENCISSKGDCTPDECPYYDRPDNEVRLCWERLMADAIILLKEQEAVVQKTGHWIWLQFCANEGVYCSECHTKMFDRYPMKKKLSQFCGHCGAKMVDEVERR